MLTGSVFGLLPRPSKLNSVSQDHFLENVISLRNVTCSKDYLLSAMRTTQTPINLRAAALTADGVDLVDVDDAGRLLSRLFEQVPDPRSAQT